MEDIMERNESYTFVMPDGAEIPAHRHTNPDGTTGGWVAPDAEIHPTAHIEFDAVVEPKARILSKARVAGTTVVPIGTTLG